MATGVDTSALYYYVTDPSTLSNPERLVAQRATAAIVNAYEHGGLLIPGTVIIELANIIHHRNGLKAVSLILEAIMEDKRNTIVAEKEEHFLEAVMLSKKAGVKYTDCLIILTLQSAKAVRIINSDKDFAKLGHPPV